MKSERASLGWIGMGQIGTPMVLRLIAAGHDVMVWGRNTARLAPALAAGAREAPSAAQVAARSEAVFLCVLDDAAVEDVVFGAAGVAEGARRGTLIVDHSTIHPQSAVAFSSRVAASSLGGSTRRYRAVRAVRRTARCRCISAARRRTSSACVRG